MGGQRLIHVLWCIPLLELYADLGWPRMSDETVMRNAFKSNDRHYLNEIGSNPDQNHPMPRANAIVF
jgi:hypothetical protein